MRRIRDIQSDVIRVHDCPNRQPGQLVMRDIQDDRLGGCVKTSTCEVNNGDARYSDVGEAAFTRLKPRLRQHLRGEARQLRIRPRRGRGKTVRKPCECIKLN